MTAQALTLNVTLRSSLNDDVDSDEVFADLLQRGYVRPETTSLPLAGEVDLFTESGSASERGFGPSSGTSGQSGV